MSECNCDDPDFPQGVCFCGSAFSCPHGRGATVGIGSKCEICHLKAENAALRERCERAEEAQTHLIYLYDCGKISLPETREIVERLKQQSLGAKEQA